MSFDKYVNYLASNKALLNSMRYFLLNAEFFDFGNLDELFINENLESTFKPLHEVIPYKTVCLRFSFLKKPLVYFVFLSIVDDNKFLEFRLVVNTPINNNEYITSPLFECYELDNNCFELKNAKWINEIIQLDQIDGISLDQLDGINELCCNILSISRSVLNLLNTRYIKTTEHLASEKLNKKRQRSGKLPLISYKTLEIIVPIERQERIDLGGTHASPRGHTRRSHLRHLKNGQVIRVKECIVGSTHGLVLKNYKITTTTPNPEITL